MPPQANDGLIKVVMSWLALYECGSRIGSYSRWSIVGITHGYELLQIKNIKIISRYDGERKRLDAMQSNRAITG